MSCLFHNHLAHLVHGQNIDNPTIIIRLVVLVVLSTLVYRFMKLSLMSHACSLNDEGEELDKVVLVNSFVISRSLFDLRKTSYDKVYLQLFLFI